MSRDPNDGESLFLSAVYCCTKYFARLPVARLLHAPYVQTLAELVVVLIVLLRSISLVRRTLVDEGSPAKETEL